MRCDNADMLQPCNPVFNSRPLCLFITGLQRNKNHEVVESPKHRYIISLLYLFLILIHCDLLQNEVGILSLWAYCVTFQKDSLPVNGCH